MKSASTVHSPSTNFSSMAMPRADATRWMAEVAGWEGLFMWDHLAFAWGVAFGVAVPGICVD